MKSTLTTIIVLAILGAGGYYVYKNYLSVDSSAKVASPSPEKTAGKDTNSDSQAQYPVPKSVKGGADDDDKDFVLPSLDKSDDSISGALAKLTDKTLLDQLFNSRDFIRSVVVTVANLTSARVPQQFLPVKPPTGEFLVDKKSHAISKDNYSRYDIYVSLAERVDINRLGRLYVRYYPLFQQVYVEDNRGYFNDKAIEVIDSLLKTPEVKEPLKVKKGIVSYKYTNESLESLNAGQKILTRMGPENSDKVKKVLKHLRAKLAKLSDEI